MRLTNADVDQWLSELAVVMPTDAVALGMVARQLADKVDALAAEAQDPAYVYDEARTRFRSLPISH